MTQSTKDNVYIIEIPGKTAREITNINYEKVSRLVEKQGGRIYIAKTEQIDFLVSCKK